MAKDKKKTTLNKIKKSNYSSKDLKSKKKTIKLKKIKPNLLRYIFSSTKTRMIKLGSELINHINNYYVRQTTLDKKVPREASGTFDYNQLSNGNRILNNISNLNESKEDHKYFVDILPSKYNWHTHPLQANIQYKSSLSWPSGQDFVYLVDHYKEVNTHFVFTADGVYTMQLTPKFRKFLHIFSKHRNIYEIILRNIRNSFGSVEYERVQAHAVYFEFIELSDLKMNRSHTKISIKDLDTRNKILNKLVAKHPSNYEAQNAIVNFDSVPINGFIEYSNSMKFNKILNKFEFSYHVKNNVWLRDIYDEFNRIKLFDVKLFLGHSPITLVNEEVNFPKIFIL